MENVLDTKFEWIGEIPSTWHTVRLKSLFDFGKGLPITKDDLLEQGVPVISYGQIHAKFNSGVGIDDRLLRYVSDSYIETNSSSLVSIGDILVADTSEDIEGCGNAVLIDKRMMLFAGYHTIILKSKELRDNRFLAYMMLTDSWRSQLRGKASGVKVFSISKKMLSECYFVIPSCSEQNRITEFLDEKCICITDIIDKTRTSIEEYKKLKHAIIAQAVTKGVCGDRVFKNTGIEWIGDVPIEWHISKAKYSISISNGSDPCLEGDIPVYGSGAKSFKTCGEFKEPPCVLIGRKGATLHIPHYIDNRYWNVDTAFDVKSLGDFNLKYYYYLAICFDYKYYISQTTLPGMTQTNYENMFIPVPSINEQAEIVSFLDNKCFEIDSMISKKELLIADLESCKKSLIYEYVTGKKEVAR